MTQDEEKELLATVKRLEASVEMLARHAQTAFQRLEWPTVPPVQHNPPLPHAIGVPAAGKPPSR